MIRLSLEEILMEAPDNFIIKDALNVCYSVLQEHNSVMCSVSGGSDSDVMVDMIVRCGGKEKTDFVFFDTGLEYQATRDHLKFIENKYGIIINIIKAKKAIPSCVKEYGVPFYSKFASEMMYRLQKHNFKWEDKSFDDLLKEYPKCKTALKWWCNVSEGSTQQYIIDRYPYLKEYIINNPPDFKISAKCCDYSKKKPSHDYVIKNNIDLICIGIRKSEGGHRAAVHKTCFSEASSSESTDSFRPVFWLRDVDKEEYCEHYGVIHSKCYTDYGLIRTGCFGCPFGKRFEKELESIQNFEPNLYVAANSIFGDSYEYTRKYLQFREHKKQNKKN